METKKDDEIRDEALDDGLAPPETFDRIRIDDLDGDAQETEGEDDSVPAPAPPSEQITELTDEERAQFRTLLTVGQLTHSFDLFEHKITIATMTTDDELRVGLVTKPYQDTQAWARAYQAAVCAAAIRTVDHKPLAVELTDDADPSVRFQHRLDVVLRYNPLVVQYIYSEYLKLEGKFAELARKLGKL